jgi:hypothetical protein
MGARFELVLMNGSDILDSDPTEYCDEKFLRFGQSWHRPDGSVARFGDMIGKASRI